MKHLILFVALLGTALHASAKIVTKAVAYEQAGTKLEGFLAYDDAKVSASHPAPGVVLFPEWWGLVEHPKTRARQLAELGYVAFAADMYGAGVTTLDPKKAGELAGQFYGKPLMAERAQAGLDQLLGTGLVDRSRVAAIGFCFGGAVAQSLAYHGAPLAGVVTFHGSLIPATTETAAANHAKFLICHGGADPLVTADAVAAFKTSLEEHKIDYQFIAYAGAVHAFTNPDADKVGAQAGLKGIGYNAAADRRSWQHMQDFFGEIFAAKK